MYLDYVRGDVVLDLGCLTLSESLEIHLLYDLHLIQVKSIMEFFIYRFIISDYLIQADHMYSMTPTENGGCDHVGTLKNAAQIETTYQRKAENNLLSVARQ